MIFRLFPFSGYITKVDFAAQGNIYSFQGLDMDILKLRIFLL